MLTTPPRIAALGAFAELAQRGGDVAHRVPLVACAPTAGRRTKRCWPSSRQKKKRGMGGGAE